MFSIEEVERFLSKRYKENKMNFAGCFAHVQNDEAAEIVAEALWGTALVHQAKEAMGRPYGWVHPALLVN